MRYPVKEIQDKGCGYSFFSLNRGSNGNNQRFLAYFESMQTDRWIIIDDDMIFNAPFLDIASAKFDEGFDHLYIDNPHCDYCRPRGIFLAGTLKLLTEIGGFDLKKYSQGYGGCHQGFTFRAINAGLATAVEIEYELQQVSTTSAHLKMQWRKHLVEFEDLQNDEKFCKIGF